MSPNFTALNLLIRVSVSRNKCFYRRCRSFILSLYPWVSLTQWIYFVYCMCWNLFLVFPLRTHFSDIISWSCALPVRSTGFARLPLGSAFASITRCLSRLLLLQHWICRAVLVITVGRRISSLPGFLQNSIGPLWVLNLEALGQFSVSQRTFRFLLELHWAH